MPSQFMARATLGNHVEKTHVMSACSIKSNSFLCYLISLFPTEFIHTRHSGKISEPLNNNESEMLLGTQGIYIR